MVTHFVTYDLNDPGQNYDAVYKALKALKAKRALESVWVLKSDLTTKAIRDRIWKHMDANDSLLVITASEWAWNGQIKTNLKDV